MSIFKENVAYRPFQYPWAVETEVQHRIDMVWHERQVDLADDLRQFTMKGGLATKDVPHEIHENILRKLITLFVEMDVQVGAGYANLLPHVKNNEIRCMWMTFACREVTHQRGYALAAETFGYTGTDWQDFKKYQQMTEKVDVLTQDCGDLTNKLNFAKQLAVVLLGEGISLFGAFACLLNLKRFGLMNGFNTVNEWSLKDEQYHVLSNTRVLGEVRKELSEEENLELDAFIKEVAKRYVDAECTFLDLVFEMGNQQDLTVTQAKDFIRYLGELRLYQLGLLPADDVRENPLEWIDYILSGSTHTNFFESKVVDYTHNGLAGEADYSKYAFALEDDFEDDVVYTVYGKKDCPYCVNAINLLKEKGCRYTYTDVNEDNEALQKIRSMGLRTVPQIWRNEYHVGGFTELSSII